jgi:DNA helicase HerA-like ATPase
MVDGEQLQRIVRQAGIEDDPEAQQLLKAAARIENEHLRQQIRKKLEQKAAEKTEHPFNEAPPQNSPLNSLYLGQTQNQDRVYTLTEDDLLQHILASGQSGSGKTTLFYNLMTQLDSPFWAFDRKQDYRHLTNQIDDLLVLPWKKLKLNPLKPPPGVAPDRWNNIFSIIFSQSFNLLTGSEGFLTTAVAQTYVKYDLYQEQPDSYPCLYDLTNLVRSDEISVGPASASYKDRVYWRLNPLLMTVGEIFHCSEGYPIHELIQRNVVFEIGGLNRNLQRFLQQILFAYIYEYLLAKGMRDEGLQLVLFADEAKQLFSVYLERQDASGIPEIDDMLAKARQMGLSTVAADQEPTKLTDSLKANTKTKILLPVADQKQFQAISESMNLDRRQSDYAKTLDTGEAVIQSGNSEPVPVDLLNYQVEQDVDDEKLRENQQEKWEKLEYTERDIKGSGYYSVNSGKDTTLDDF